MLPGNPPQRQDACSQSDYSADSNKAPRGRATDRMRGKKSKRKEHDFIKSTGMLVGSAEWLQTMAPRAAAACAHSLVCKRAATFP